MAKRKAETLFVGHWRIVSMDQWDVEDAEEEGPAPGKRFTGTFKPVALRQRRPGHESQGFFRVNHSSECHSYGRE